MAQSERRSNLRDSAMDHVRRRPHPSDELALNTDRQEFTPEDIRFTKKGDVLYAIVLGWPQGGRLRIRSLWRGNPYLSGTVSSVQLLGTAAALRWKQEADGLYIDLPNRPPDEPAFAFRILKSKNGKSVE